jgi:tRNA threonylcarbamoyladenosine biosynthesis protein TsaE
LLEPKNNREDGLKMSRRFQTASEDETRALARRVAADLVAGSTILLTGDLGAGKTAFVRGLAEGLGIDPDEVTSPTFTLVHEYRGGRLPLVHVDLYRLERASLDEIGLDSDLAAAGVLAIEWADRLVLEPADAVRIRMEDAGGESRAIDVAQ